MNRKAKKGFTLVELVIVIAVIAILSSVLIPVFGNVISDAKLSAAKSSVSNAISQFTMSQATAGNDASIGDGYIYVFENAVAQNVTTVNSNAKPQYVFKYQGGELQETSDEYAVLAGANGEYKLDGEFKPVFNGSDVKSFTVEKGGKVIAIPLNAEFSVTPPADANSQPTATVKATIWLVYSHPAA